MFEVQLLGPVRAVVGGGVVRIDSARRRALLATLALRPGATVSIDALCEALWGDDLPANARGNLQSHVSRLRSRLGEGSVVLEPGGYRLALEDSGTDVGQVERAARAAEACRATAPAAAAAGYQSALDRWRGPALVEFAGNPAFLPDIARLEELQRTLRDDLHDARLDAGEAVSALPGIERAARDQPLRERSQLLLVRALHLSGRSAEALRAGDAYRRRLADETGLDPGPALAELERRILTGEATGPNAPAGTPVPPVAPTPPTVPPGAPDPPTGPPVAPVPPTVPQVPPVAPDPPAGPLRPAPGSGLPRGGRFFGRGQEIDLLRSYLRSERLVTVVGTGGVGKTRLVAEALAGDADTGDTGDTGNTGDRCLVVELAPVGDGEVAMAVAAALDLRAPGPDLSHAVAEYLAAERALLVLDNCEHVAAEVQGLVARVLADCPGITVLATSRFRLGLDAERVLPLGPLTAEGPGSPAVRLFVDRAARARADPAALDPGDDAGDDAGDPDALDPGDDAGDPDLPVVEQICRRLDGIPLAVELAAGRTSALPTGALRDRLDQALDLLERPALGPERRHATLRQVVQWSYRLLDEGDQHLLAVLSVFEGGFDLGAAEHVAAAEVDRPVAVGLGRLVDASLVVVDRRDGPAARYRELEAVRQLGRERLAARDRTAAVLSRHAEWITRFVADLAQRRVGPEEAEVVRALARERGNVRLALRHVTAGGRREEASALAQALAGLCVYRPDAEWLAWLRTGPDLAAGEDEPADVVRAAAARAAYLQGDLNAIEALARPVAGRRSEGAAADLARHALGVAALYAGRYAAAEAWWGGIGDAVDAAGGPSAARLDALAGIALARCYRGDLTGARDAADDHLALADAADSGSHRAFAGYVGGEILLAGGRPGPAIDALGAAADRARSAGATFIEGLALTALVAAAVRAGRGEEAARRLPSVLELWRRSSTWPQLWTTLRFAADVLVARGAFATAALVLAAADADAAAPAVTGADVERLAGLRARIAERVPASELRTIGRRARVLPRARVLADALDALQQVPTAPR